MKPNANIREDIRTAARGIADLLSGTEYLESQHRRLLSRALKNKGYDVYQEVPMTFTLPNDPIPFGHGFIDILILTKQGVIILELKITAKNCKKQLHRYMNHWNHTPVLFGMTVNFVSDNVIIEDVEGTYKEAEKEAGHGGLTSWIKETTISGC